MIRRKVPYLARRLGRYCRVVIDGTGVLVFSARHCAHCLTVTRRGQTLYYHPMLEAKKVFFFLLQIAHLLSQLLGHGSLLRQAFPAGLGSAKNRAHRLLEAWRNWRLTPTEFPARLAGRFQIRFDTS